MYHFILGLRGGFERAGSLAAERFSPPGSGFVFFFVLHRCPALVAPALRFLPELSDARNSGTPSQSRARSRDPPAQKYAANRKTVMITTAVVACTSLNDGAVTFLISVRTSL